MTKKIIVYLCIMFLISGCSIQNGNGENTAQTSQTTATPVKEIIKYDENELKMDSNRMGYIYETDEIPIIEANREVLHQICSNLVDKYLQKYNEDDFDLIKEKVEYETYFI